MAAVSVKRSIVDFSHLTDERIRQLDVFAFAIIV